MGTKLPVVIFGLLPVDGKVIVVQGAPGVTDNDSRLVNGPFAPDHPPLTEIGFGEMVNDQNDSDHRLGVYRLDESQHALYPTTLPVVEKLRPLLASRSEGDLDRMAVPVYPIPNALELIKVKTRYFDAASAKAQAFLPGQPDDSFQPSLGALRQWMSTLTFREPWER